MDIEQKQNYRDYFQNSVRKYPDYYISSLAEMWRQEIVIDRMKSSTPPGTIETREIFEDCLNRIHAAIESGELEASYPEKDIQPAILHSTTGETIQKEIKYPALWIVETTKYIEWARLNGAGPAILVNDVIDIVTDDTDNQPFNLSKQKDTLDERERQTLLAIIFALINQQGKEPLERGLAKSIAETTEHLGIPKSEGAIREHLKRAAKLTE